MDGVRCCAKDTPDNVGSSDAIDALWICSGTTVKPQLGVCGTTAIAYRSTSFEPRGSLVGANDFASGVSYPDTPSMGLVLDSWMVIALVWHGPCLPVCVMYPRETTRSELEKSIIPKPAHRRA